VGVPEEDFVPEEDGDVGVPEAVREDGSGYWAQ